MKKIAFHIGLTKFKGLWIRVVMMHKFKKYFGSIPVFCRRCWRDKGCSIWGLGKGIGKGWKLKFKLWILKYKSLLKSETRKSSSWKRNQRNWKKPYVVKSSYKSNVTKRDRFVNAWKRQQILPQTRRWRGW